MTLSQLEVLDKPGQHAVLIAGNLDWLPDDNDSDLEADLIDIDEWMLAGLPQTDYQPVGIAAEYGLVQDDF